MSIYLLYLNITLGNSTPRVKSHNDSFLDVNFLHLAGAGSSYKKEKAAKMKSLSSNGHNWNTLFLGQNAVVDVLAQRMNTSKSKILETENADSLAVRMALGETQIVAETREFLMSHGVQLDAFGQVSLKFIP